MITEKLTCRLCDSQVKPVFSFTSTPIANDYKLEPDSNADRYPLELTQCTECDHVQQRFVISGLFEDYKYATPKTVARYLDPTAKLLRKRFPEAKTVLEIGSNNGTYLEVLRANGFIARGVDPAATGDCNMQNYFSENWAKKHYEVMLTKYDLIVANNVFAHIDDLQDVFRGIDLLLADDGALVFEVQYLPDLIESGSFDMIYHEHMSYHTVQPLKRFLRRYGLIMTDVDHIPLHGGSVRITAQRSGKESKWIDSPPDWVRFFGKVHDVREKLRAKLNGGQYIAFGAAAKATTLIHYCGLSNSITHCVDDTPQKQGRYIPGTDIQILPTTEVKDGDPILMLAWNYEREIREMFPTSELIHPFK